MLGTAFQKRLTLQWMANSRNATTFDLIIPDGRRFVIREVSGAALMPCGFKSLGNGPMVHRRSEVKSLSSAGSHASG